MDEEVSEQTVLLVKDVSVYKIPPRTRSEGFNSGEWKVIDKIWNGRLRVVIVGTRCEVRLEDITSGELFAMCPVVVGMKDAVVEPARDSSRYFIVRVEDDKGHHAFLGLGFVERNDAFDFNVALTDFERHARREEEAAARAQRGEGQGEASGAADLTHHVDYSLAEGQTIHVNLKHARPSSGRPKGFSGNTCFNVGNSNGSGFKLAPPVEDAKSNLTGSVNRVVPGIDPPSPQFADSFLVVTPNSNVEGVAKKDLDPFADFVGAESQFPKQSEAQGGEQGWATFE
mmetsp:Transcript_24173/g.33265  ORF Transcript_24173/g.33265 Transcript_24173/m.33265 type:complete len:285 (+) Transcript_24173:88-942(+)|eukprot:CAMPEP_0196594064 /NCGR_PEP_ID=MMETSP1081-20130531/77283_1 /TAXON_ID=36882 /ORGANISM="Pyramimonas amylifera, Strain CCMP720" /LENGTH=284 /DNA_ID=CAMNT_0041918223 /DNA_START=77 /DNA_END=931 /DNA_ORIENTATION=-